MKALQTVKTVLAVIGLFALGILTGSFLYKKKGAVRIGEAEKARKEKKNEIENTPAADLVAGADNADALRTTKDGIKTDFRERIRHRLEEELHRFGSDSID